MARLEEEHPPGPPVPATPRPEDLATGERRDEDQFIRRWNVEGFRVHLFSGNHEPIAQTSRDRVILLHHPHMRRLLVLTPSGNASRMSKQFLEGTGIQRRVQGKEPHPTLLHVTENAFQRCILNLAVLQVTEPHKNVGPLKISLGDPLVGISKVSDAGLEVMTRLGKDLGDDAVDPRRVERLRFGPFTPRKHPDWPGWTANCLAHHHASCPATHGIHPRHASPRHRTDPARRAVSCRTAIPHRRQQYPGKRHHGDEPVHIVEGWQELSAVRHHSRRKSRPTNCDAEQQPRRATDSHDPVGHANPVARRCTKDCAVVRGNERTNPEATQQQSGHGRVDAHLR